MQNFRGSCREAKVVRTSLKDGKSSEYVQLSIMKPHKDALDIGKRTNGGEDAKQI